MIFVASLPRVVTCNVGAPATSNPGPGFEVGSTGCCGGFVLD